jgi:hypothetical protein
MTGMTGMSLAQPEEPHPRLRSGVTSISIVEKEKAPERIPQLGRKSSHSPQMEKSHARGSIA